MMSLCLRCCRVFETQRAANLDTGLARDPHSSEQQRETGRVCQGPKMATFGNLIYLQVCSVFHCDEGISYCWSALLPFISLCSRRKVSVRGCYRFQLQNCALRLSLICERTMGCCDRTLSFTGEEKCPSEPLYSTYLITGIFVLNCCLKRKGYFKNDWMNCSPQHFSDLYSYPAGTSWV